jgi:hypothetical protein
MSSGPRNIRTKFTSPWLTHFGGIYLLKSCMKMQKGGKYNLKIGEKDFHNRPNKKLGVIMEDKNCYFLYKLGNT